MRDLTRFLALMAWALLLLLLLSPWLLYELGLSRLERLPTPPAQLATAEQQAWVWQQARSQGMPQVEPMNPYGFRLRFFNEAPVSTPGERLTLWVAREHLLQLPRRRMGWWHLSYAALSIWLSRHWSAEELASAASPSSARGRPPGPRLTPPRPES